MQPHVEALGVGIDRATQQRQCILELAGAGIQCTQSVERPYMVGRDRQDRSIVLFRVVPTAVAVKPHGGLKSEIEVLLTPGWECAGIHGDTPWRVDPWVIGALPDRTAGCARAGAGWALACIRAPTRRRRPSRRAPAPQARVTAAVDRD